MARIDCPNCKKPASSKHKQCPHCQYALQGLTEQNRQAIATQHYYEQKQKLMNHSFLALILFLSGFLYLYSRTPEPQSTEMMICQGAIAVGFLWYLINRIRIVFLKKK